MSLNLGLQMDTEVADSN